MRQPPASAAARVLTVDASSSMGRRFLTSGHYLDLALVRVVGAFEREDFLERPDRYLDLVERRLPRREPLQPQARRQQRHQDAVALMLAGEADQLVGETGDDRQEQDAGGDQ